MADVGYGILSHYQKLESDGKLTREQAQPGAMAELKSRRYDKVEYFWLNDTNQVVGNLESIRKTIMEVNEISSSIAAAVEEQGAATRAIAHSVQAAASGTDQVSQKISGVTDATAATGQAAGVVLQSSGRLSQRLQSLEDQVSAFVAGVRAA